MVEIKTKDGCDGGDNWFQIYGGQRDTVRPSFQLQGCGDKFSYYAHRSLSAIQPGFQLRRTPLPIRFTMRSDEGQGFAYLTYQLDSACETQPDVGRDLRRFAIPQRSRMPAQWQLDDLNPAFYPSTADQLHGWISRTISGCWRWMAWSGESLDYQLAYSTHYNNQNFHPDRSAICFTRACLRTCSTAISPIRLQGDVTYRLNSAHTFGAGFYFGEYGIEVDDHSLVFPVDGEGKQIHTTSGFSGRRI